MTHDEPGLRPNMATIGGTVVPLLAVAAFINYADRGNLATAAPLIKDELGLSATQIGLLLSAFFWSYVPAQLLAGWLAERINAYRTLAIGLALWSVATAASGLATGFVTLMAQHYDWAFVIAAAIAALGIVGWGLMIRKVEALDWEPVPRVGDEGRLMRGLT